MADTIREQIAQKVEQTLRGSGKPAALNVHRFRTRPIQKDKLPAAVIYFRNESQDDGATDQTDRDLQLVVELRAEVPVSEAPDQALDPYYSWVVSALMADEQLGGLSTMITELGTEWDAQEGEKIYAGSATTFEIRYITLRSDPETQA